MCAAIASARLPHLPAGEMKWTKVSNSKLPAYLRVVDAFFDVPKRSSGPHFHSLVVDMHRVNDRRFNDGSRDLGFNKEVYQLLMKQRRLYPKSIFHVYPDYRSTPNSPEELRLVLNRGARKSGDNRDWPFRRIHWRQSEDEPCIQLVDILIGALGFQLNGHINAADASPAKRELSLHITERAGIRDIMRDTARAGTFTMWHRQLQ